MLYLENPDLPDLDIGRNSYMMPKIRRSFEHAHQLLTNALGKCVLACVRQHLVLKCVDLFNV